MLQGNFEQVINRIAKSSGLMPEEIKKRIEAKQAKLSNLISKEGAAQIVASELGVNFENEKLKISELLPGMKKANFTAKVLRAFPAREFNRNGKEGKVLNFVAADDTGNIKVVLWDTNHISLFENGSVVEGGSVEIINSSVRDGEVHLGSFSEIKLSNETFNFVEEKRATLEKNILELKPGMSVSIRAFVVQIFEPRFFDVCPECGKKLVDDVGGKSCAQHGKVLPMQKALLNLVLDDGTETIRAVLFNDAIEKSGFKLEDNFTIQKESLLGKEMIISGNVRQNKVFNNAEIIVNDIKEVNLEELIKKLENAT